MTTPIPEDHYISIGQKITSDVLNTSIQSLTEGNNISDISSNLTTISLNSSSDSVKVLSKQVSDIIVKESLHEIDVVDGPSRREEQEKIDSVVQDTINTSLQDTTELFEILTAEERHQRNKFNENFIDLNSDHKNSSTRYNNTSANSKSSNSSEKLGSFPSSNRPKSAHPNNFRNNKIENTKLLKNRPVSAKQPKIRTNSAIKPPKLPKNHQKLDKIYNQTKLTSSQDQNLSQTQKALKRVSASNYYDDNEAIRKAIMNKNSRNFITKHNSSTFSTSSKISSNKKGSVTSASKLVTQPLKHPTKNKSYTFDKSRIYEIQRENQRLFKNVTKIRQKQQQNQDSRHNQSVASSRVSSASTNTRNHKKSGTMNKENSQNMLKHIKSSKNKALVQKAAKNEIDIDDNRQNESEKINYMITCDPKIVDSNHLILDNNKENNNNSELNDSISTIQADDVSEISLVSTVKNEKVKSSGKSKAKTLNNKKSNNNSYRPISAASSQVSTNSRHSLYSNFSNMSKGSKRSVRSNVSQTSRLSSTLYTSRNSPFFRPAPAAKLNREREQERIDRENFRIYERLTKVKATMSTR